jgi:2-polyprenyl-3-methyl-5-hydroxy-6-metoxy-1,4-benzoquinol methylase
MRLNELREYWDNAAASFDDEPDHGLQDPQLLQAWVELLKKWLPTNHAAILDLGCGTGSLSVVMAGLGHEVTGIDISPAMIARAKAKATAFGYPIKFHIMDAAVPQFPPRLFDAIVCRHLLWALPEPATVLPRWVGLLKPGGRLVLIEGYWSTGAGMHVAEIVAALPSSVTSIAIQDLSGQPIYWGRPVTDERYAVIADLYP